MHVGPLACKLRVCRKCWKYVTSKSGKDTKNNDKKMKMKTKKARTRTHCPQTIFAPFQIEFGVLKIINKWFAELMKP